jgi:hypothetical protein
MSGSENLEGTVGTNCGKTTIRVRFCEEGTCELSVWSGWLSDTPLDVTFTCLHTPAGSHYGFLVIERAVDGESGADVALPPSDGALVVEYVRVPTQHVSGAGSDAMSFSGWWTTDFTMVLWLHPDAAFDDGTALEESEYDVPPEQFKRAAEALHWLVKPWKLG